jgi:hypothetical protein
MKKILFALVALLPLLVSCGKEGKGDTTFEDPHFIQYAGRLVANSAVPAAQSSATKATGLIGILKSIEFTESGLYVVGREVNGQLEFLTGSYSVNGNTYNLNNFGTVEFKMFGSTAAVSIDYLNGMSEALTAQFLKATSANVIYRGWTIDKTRVTINGFHTPATADFVGCNFDEMAKFLNDNGHKGSLLPSGSLKSISITGAGSIIFGFSDNTADLGSCTVSGNSVSFSWQSGSRLMEVENGKATIDYMDGKCILKIEAALKGSTTSGVVTFVLSPMD